MALPDFEGWAIFATVAEQRSFSSAAATLHLSKATVSKAVTRLEGRLGVALFHRTSRRLTLTDSGAALVERAQAILADATEAEECAREEAGLPSGTVRLAVPMSFGVSHVAPVISRFLSVYPDVSVDLHLSDARVDLVGDGYDAALRIGALGDSSLLSRTLRPVALGLYASPAYLDRYGTPDHPRDLKSHRLFCYSYAANEQVLRLTRGDEEHIVQLRGPLRANNADAMIPAVVAGHGIAPLPDFIGTDAKRIGAIVRLLPDWQAPPVALHLVTPPGRLRPRRVEALLAFLIEALSDSRISAS
jgi:DNA-binding transcriptional LysR family regulator